MPVRSRFSLDQDIDGSLVRWGPHDGGVREPPVEKVDRGYPGLVYWGDPGDGDVRVCRLDLADELPGRGLTRGAEFGFVDSEFGDQDAGVGYPGLMVGDGVEVAAEGGVRLLIETERPELAPMPEETMELVLRAAGYPRLGSCDSQGISVSRMPRCWTGPWREPGQVGGGC